MMELTSDFSFEPLPPLADPVRFPFPQIASSLGPLAGLAGTWRGGGFNVIWRPNHTPPGQDRFLELNLTSEQLEFTAIPGPIPNRGLLQPDMNMFGLTYLQQISDANLHAGLHIEPGLWVAVPATSDPKEDPTVARLASIPQGRRSWPRVRPTPRGRPPSPTSASSPSRSARARTGSTSPSRTSARPAISGPPAPG
jgi:hypothetical protein